MTEHRHVPRNVNVLHAAEQSVAGFNTKIAIAITKGMGTMICAYIFAILAIIGFPGWQATPTQYVQWVSQTFIQLVALSVLAVGQSMLGRHAELMAEEQFETTQRSYHDIEQIIEHLNKQDEKILEILEKLERQPARRKKAKVQG